MSAHQKLKIARVIARLNVGGPATQAILMTDAFLGFALGLLTATRVELYLRARRLLAAG